MSTTPRKRTPAKKATAARQAEAGDGFVTVEQCGVELRIPIGDNVPLEAIEVISQEVAGPQSKADELRDDIAVTRALVGPEQWETFKAARPTLRDYRELSSKIVGLTGN
ncbi:hypothetical protein [Mycobacterium sp. 48b]|uniref:hypothetical protein n=1 Tax=Mycobacterium sp. 48b TaxID=3400426 RepID=UPI003AB0570F